MMNAMPMPMMPNHMPMMGMNPMMMMNPMMGMGMGMSPMMVKMTMEMTKDGMVCKMVPTDPAHLDMMKDRMTMMMQSMQQGMHMMMMCGHMPMMMSA